MWDTFTSITMITSHDYQNYFRDDYCVDHYRVVLLLHGKWKWQNRVSHPLGTQLGDIGSRLLHLKASRYAAGQIP